MDAFSPLYWKKSTTDKASPAGRHSAARSPLDSPLSSLYKGRQRLPGVGSSGRNSETRHHLSSRNGIQPLGRQLQVSLAHNVVPLKDRPRLVTGQLHCDPLRNTGPDQIPDRCAAEVGIRPGHPAFLQAVANAFLKL